MEGLYFFVDRVSDGIATLLFTGDDLQSLVLPLAALPNGVREGDYLLFSLSIDRNKGIVAKEEIETLFEALEDKVADRKSVV